MVPERAFRVNFFACWAAVGLLAACQAGFANGEFRKDGVRYRVGPAPAGYRQVGLSGNDLAFMSDHSGHSMAVNATCEGYDDASLEVLTHQLLMGFTDIHLLDQRHEPLDGRDSLRSHLTARLDGVPTELLLVVLKRSGCVFDLTYLSPPGRFNDELPAFEGLLHNFDVEAPR